ncbi:FGGY-family carbohydrate kinase [Schaalia vaccimaxillae]|uniref:FGGY-family carbohydrate kinase n=1 Tax=Schaalia vaccimaxillae TaxID=183916 RepID=UPI0004191273|nr:FGGY-family carbohydrate kinase [Schaalia vaccimaxillae]
MSAKKEPLILAIDGGSQSTKVSLFSLQGELICQYSEKLQPMRLAPDGVVEHPDDDLWTSLIAACRGLWEIFDGDRNDIIGVGLCTIRFCRALLKSDGTLAQPVLSWMDQRVSRPYEHVNPKVAWVTTSSGYITHRLTGEFKDTAANYAGQWPLDPHSWKWSEDSKVWKTHAGLNRSMLFELVQPGAVAGQITERASQDTGIPAGLPVVVTANDKAVEGLGGGLLEDNEALVSLGTYITGMMLGRDYVDDSKTYWSNYSALAGKYLYESDGIRRGMWTVSWLVSLLGPEFADSCGAQGILPEAKLDKEASLVSVGSDGLIVGLDFLAPADRPHLKGTFIGLDARHTRAHMHRSIIEGIAMTMSRNVSKMAAERGISLERLILSGGGANSELMCQIFADCSGLPVVRNVNSGGVGLGSAMLVGIALGYFADAASAATAFARRGDEFYPNAEAHKTYQKVISSIQPQISATLDPIYKNTYKIFG